jgi:FkbM family methyltransferase
MTAVVHGALLRLPASHHLPGLVAAHPSYDTALPELAKFLYARKLQQLIVIDVGANVGDTAALIAAAVGADNVKFICIEGDPQYLPFLRQNASSLDADIIVGIAGASDGGINASLMGDHGTSSVVLGVGLTKMISIESVTDRTIDILKIDTDGFEFEVLKGAGTLLHQPNIIVFTEYSPTRIRKYGHTDPTNIFALMSKAGFNRVLAYDNIGIPIGVFSTTGDMLTSLSEYAERKPSYNYFDLLFDRDGDRLSAFYDSECRRLLPP